MYLPKFSQSAISYVIHWVVMSANVVCSPRIWRRRKWVDPTKMFPADCRSRRCRRRVWAAFAVIATLDRDSGLASAASPRPHLLRQVLLPAAGLLAVCIGRCVCERSVRLSRCLTTGVAVTSSITWSSSTISSRYLLIWIVVTPMTSSFLPPPTVLTHRRRPTTS